MNDILTDTAKSFKMIRPKTKSGTYKPQLTYCKKQMDTLYINLATDQEELLKGMLNLFGPDGAKKSFKRYYYPKRFIYNSVLYIKPRVFTVADDKTKMSGIRKTFPGFNGMAKPKLMDRRNCIVDFTDIFELAIPKDRGIMIRSTVLDYIIQIWPELICYALFNNPRHDKENDKESDDAMSKSSLESYLENESGLKEAFTDISEEEWKHLVDICEISVEAFNELVMSKTKVFSMGATTIGLSKFGFDKFIISIPYTLKANRFVQLKVLMGKYPITNQIKRNPDLIYQISILQLVYKAYEKMFNGGITDDFASEFAKRNVTFHFYSETGVGFAINFKEIKDQMHLKPEQFARRMVNRLQILTMCNTGVIKESDLDKIDEDAVENEVLGYYQKNGDYLDVKEQNNNKSKLREEFKEIVHKDMALKTVLDAKKENFMAEIELADNSQSPKKKVDFSHLEVNKDAVLKGKGLLNKLAELEKSFKNKIIKIDSDSDDAIPISYSSQDFNDILNSGEEEDSDNITENEEDNPVTDASNDYTIGDDGNEEPTVKDFEDEYTVVEEEDDEYPEDEEDDEDVYTGTPKPVTKFEEPMKVVSKRTAAEQKRLNILKEKYKSVKLDGKPIGEIVGNSAKIEITNAVSDINKPKTKDKNVTKLRTMSFQKSYMAQNYQSDIINAVRSLSMNKERPLYITNANVEDSSTQFQTQMTYTFTLEDETKKKHTLKFDVPKLNESGVMTLNGSQYYLKKQLIRIPILKIAPDKVYVTTELNSYQVMRTGTTLNKGTEVIRRLFSEFLTDYKNISIERGDCTDDNAEYLTTLEYDNLANRFFYIRINDDKAKYGEHVVIYFSQKAIRQKIETNHINTGFKDNIIPDNVLPIAINFTTNSLIYIDMNKNSSVNSTIVGIIDEYVKPEGLYEFVKNVKPPKRRICTKIEIQSFTVPLIVFLLYLFGWERVSSYFKESQLEFSEKKLKNTNKLSIKFANGYLYYNQYPINGALFFNGLSEINTENYNFEDINNPGLYVDYTFKKFKSRNIVKGWVTAKENMLDLKTLKILEELKLPTDFLEIFLYCNELLVDNQVKSDTDISNYRLRSAEVISECLYKVINDYYMQWKKKSGKRNSMTIPQTAVIAKVRETDLLEAYDSLSPVGELRSMGLTTFKGQGGTKVEQAFTTKKRAYDSSYFGVFGISTPDNSNAGIIKELSMNANITNTLGFLEPVTDRNKVSINDIAPPAEAVTPFVTKYDDPTRISFTSVQNNHVGGMINASLPPVRTGVEKVIQFQTSERFAKLAKQDGVVSDVDEIGKKIYVTYKDGSKDVIDYNNYMIKNSDAFNQASYSCFVKAGQKIRNSDTLAADERFFKVDPITKELIYTQTINAMVAIVEGSYTEDDSDLISESFADKLKMDFTKCKQISIGAMDTIIDFKKVGDHVELGDPLFVFDEYGTFGGSEDGDDEIYSLLVDNLDPEMVSQMIHQTPKAPITGTISDIKIYWTVPVDKMSPSVAKFVNSYILKIKKEVVEEEKFSGKKSPKRVSLEISKPDVNTGRVNGCEMPENGGILIEYFISHDDTMSTGDKIALNSALKTVNSTVVQKHEEPYTDSGLRLDGLFSFISIEARMINSVWYNGWLGLMLYKKSKSIARNFLKEIGETVPINERTI